MKLYDDVTKAKMHNYTVQPKHHPNTGTYKQARPISVKQMTDNNGLHKAYAVDDKLYAHGDTLYIAGTSSLRDVWDDLNIPFHLT